MAITNHLCIGPERLRLLKAMPSRRFTAGFSLVEVVIAIGLSTFALLVMFSLLPVGLNTLQDANRQIMETEIFNTVGAELNSTEFDKLDDFVNDASQFPRYYDIEGQKIDSAAGAVFIVRCEIPAADPGDIAETLRVIVKVGFQRDPVDSAAPQKKRAFLLSNRGI